MKAELWRNAFPEFLSLLHADLTNAPYLGNNFPNNNPHTQLKMRVVSWLSNNKLLGGKLIFVFTVVEGDGNYLEVMLSK